MNFALVLLVLIPVVGAIIGAALPNARIAKFWALGVSLATALVTVVLVAQFNWHAPAHSTADAVQLRFGPDAKDSGQSSLALRDLGFSFSLGVDSISLWLVILTVFLTPLAIAASFESIRDREKAYYAWMLALLAAMLGVFIARDLLLFYVFFELTLVPMFFIIGIWGGPERRYAAGKFFLFTFAGSVFTLAGIVYLGLNSPRGFDLYGGIDYARQLAPTTRYWLLLAFLAGFAVKVPLFPVHTWLPLAHVEAPTAG